MKLFEPFAVDVFFCIYSSLVPLFVWDYCCCCETTPPPFLRPYTLKTGAVLLHQNGLFTPRAVTDSCFAVCCSSPHTPWHTSPPETAACLSVCGRPWLLLLLMMHHSQPESFWGEKFRSDFLHSESLHQLILLIGSSMEITRGMIGSPGSRRLRGFSQPLILPSWIKESGRLVRGSRTEGSWSPGKHTQ